jgi:hypothetical protein
MKINSGRVSRDPPPARTLRIPAIIPTPNNTGICQYRGSMKNDPFIGK